MRMSGRTFIIDQEQGPSLAASSLGPSRGAGLRPQPPPRIVLSQGALMAMVGWTMLIAESPVLN